MADGLCTDALEHRTSVQNCDLMNLRTTSACQKLLHMTVEKKVSFK